AAQGGRQSGERGGRSGDRVGAVVGGRAADEQDDGGAHHGERRRTARGGEQRGQVRPPGAHDGRGDRPGGGRLLGDAEVDGPRGHGQQGGGRDAERAQHGLPAPHADGEDGRVQQEGPQPALGAGEQGGLVAEEGGHVASDTSAAASGDPVDVGDSAGAGASPVSGRTE